MSTRLKTPVIFLIFNRPEATRAVFDRIRAARPAKLIVVSDGPRADRPGEEAKVLASRAITAEIDWPCEVKRDYATANLGCRARISSGLTNAFRQVDHAIVLEDDCLPEPSFFPFCENLLARYRNERRVSAIGGTSFFPFPNYPYSYKFSIYPHFWGWATWARAWEQYASTENRWLESRDRHRLIAHACPSQHEFRYWERALDSCFDGTLSSWGYQWMLTGWLNHTLTAVPKHNLITNIGFGEAATHTKSKHFSAMRSSPIGEILHPPSIVHDAALDRRLSVQVLGSDRRLRSRLLQRLTSTIRLR